MDGHEDHGWSGASSGEHRWATSRSDCDIPTAAMVGEVDFGRDLAGLDSSRLQWYKVRGVDSSLSQPASAFVGPSPPSRTLRSDHWHPELRSDVLHSPAFTQHCNGAVGIRGNAFTPAPLRLP